jgi:predicted RNA-binding protein with PUA-like domain
MKYWLMKSEPETFSIDDLAKRPKKTEFWDGVRNYQARNMMRDEMKLGDLAFFYHSNCTPPGIAGIVKVAKEAYPDTTALDPKSKYFDPKASKENPRWFAVEVQLVEKFDELIPLNDLRQNPKLKDMQILAKGNRLSITPVSKKEWDAVLKMTA